MADAGSLVSAELMELLAGEAGVPLNVATVDSFPAAAVGPDGSGCRRGRRWSR